MKSFTSNKGVIPNKYGQSPLPGKKARSKHAPKIAVLKIEIKAKRTEMSRCVPGSFGHRTAKAALIAAEAELKRYCL